MLGVVAAVLLALAGCGDDDDGTADARPVEPSDDGGLTVVAKDIDFGADAYAAAAGTIPVTYRNEGNIPHTLVIEDVDGFELEVSSKGDVDEGTVELEAGEYTVFCDVPGHRGGGMEATLLVE